MEIDLNNEQKKLLLETVAIAHEMELLRGKDNSHLAQLIGKIHDALIEDGNPSIFHSVYLNVFPRVCRDKQETK